jgi:hypothetical protein
MKLTRLTFLLAGIFAGSTGPALAAKVAAAASTQAPPPAPVTPVSIDGFRSAHFGMDESAVRRAIGADFRLSGAAIKSGTNPVQRTELLSVTVSGLVQGAGKAVVDYVFGYKSHDLIEVNVAWTTELDPANTPSVLLHTSATLQSYFQNEEFPAGQSISNRVLPNGSILLFRGTDAEGHTVLMALTGPISKPDKNHHVVMQPADLALAYSENPEHPDVFRLARGSF